MDLILRSDKYKPHGIRKLNYCRLYLQAVTISDITIATGDYLDPSMLRGIPSVRSSISRWHQVNQERPSATVWNLWKRANLLWSRPDGALIRPLGKWIYSIHHQRRLHFSYRHGPHKLYVKTSDDQYQAFEQTPVTPRFAQQLPALHQFVFHIYPCYRSQSKSQQRPG